MLAQIELAFPGVPQAVDGHNLSFANDGFREGQLALQVRIALKFDHKPS
jgi:hypothetical protein